MMSTFGERLRALREGAGMSRAELADAAGVARDSIASLELGRREPSWGTVQALAAALKVNCLAFTAEQAQAQPEPAAERPAPKKTSTTRKSKKEK